MEGIIRAWGRILAGYQPNLSIEITRECPLTCPGCYAYGSDHLGGDVTLRELQDFKGQQLVDAMFALLDKHKPLHVSIVGGEPLVRFRELSEILPRMADMGIYTQLVTSAVRPIPIEWAGLRRLQLVVSIDGLQPEHDERRKPATYERILKHIEGHDIRVHCTVTRQQVRRDGYLEEFAKFWSANPAVSQIWISLYTPQVGEISAERLTQGRPPEGGRRSARDSARSTRSCARRRRCSTSYVLPPALAGRLHLREDDGVRVGEFREADHAVPVRRQPRLRELRVHRIGGACGGRPSQAAGRHSGREAVRRVVRDWESCEGGAGELRDDDEESSTVEVSRESGASLFRKTFS